MSPSVKNGPHSKPRRPRCWQVLLLIFFTGFVFAFAQASDDDDERRVRSGLRLFRSLLAADEQLEQKAGDDGVLEILVLYVNNKPLAERYAGELRALGDTQIQGKPLRVSVSDISRLQSDAQPVPAAIYLVQSLYDNELQQLIGYGIREHVIVYSPFKDDVARGILAGLAIDTRVLPLINMQTLSASQIRIKAFYLKVAKQL